jgi:hypothetical protein
MRALFLAALLATVTTAASATEPTNARAAYVERRGLIEADAQCRLFTPSIRAALQVGAAQARGALLRSGWNNAQMRNLEQTVVAAARGRACNDARTATSAADARRAFTTWVNASSMEFPGWERTWIARRVVPSRGASWRLSQAIDGPIPAVFGVRDQADAQHLSVVIPVAPRATAPTSVRLIMRDASRARAMEIGLPQRMAQGLAAGAPSPSASRAVPSTRSIERLEGSATQAVFVFPDDTLRNVLALDPRESIELRVESGRSVQSLYVEVGDIAAARSFLVIR